MLMRPRDVPCCAARLCCKVKFSLSLAGGRREIGESSSRQRTTKDRSTCCFLPFTCSVLLLAQCITVSMNRGERIYSIRPQRLACATLARQPKEHVRVVGFQVFIIFLEYDLFHASELSFVWHNRLLVLQKKRNIISVEQSCCWSVRHCAP